MTETQTYSFYCLVLPAERYPPPREWFHTEFRNYRTIFQIKTLFVEVLQTCSSLLVSITISSVLDAFWFELVVEECAVSLLDLFGPG